MIATCGFRLRWLIVTLLLGGFLWMDICLYLKIQSYDEDKERVNAKYDDDLYERQTFNISSMGYIQSLTHKFSFAFEGMSVKLIMSDPVDNYIMGPLAELFARLCDFKHRFLFISANMVSYCGVVSALIAARLVSYESPRFHKLSFVFFQIRTFLDDLDGIVARARRGIYKHVSLTNTSGYVIDGVCDTIGFAAYIIGCYVFLADKLRRSGRGQTHENTINRLNLRPITGSRSPTSEELEVSYSPLEQQEDASASETHESGSDYETFRETNDEEVEIVCHDSSREATPLFDTEANTYRQKSHSPAQLLFDQDHTDDSKAGRPSNLVLYGSIRKRIADKLSERGIALLLLAFAVQLALCSFFWNRYILIYRDLLESPSSNILQARAKRKVLKSNIMFFLFWFWRLTNGHSFMQLFAGAILTGRVLRFLEIIKYVGFVGILLLAIMTELHVRDVKNYLNELG